MENDNTGCGESRSEQEQELCEAAKTALFVQGAVNLTAVVHAWSRILREVLTIQKLGTDGVRSHPINILFASKVASLTGCDSGMEFSKAYDAVINLAKVG